MTKVNSWLLFILMATGIVCCLKRRTEYKCDTCKCLARTLMWTHAHTHVHTRVLRTAGVRGRGTVLLRCMWVLNPAQCESQCAAVRSVNPPHTWAQTVSGSAAPPRYL